MRFRQVFMDVLDIDTFRNILIPYIADYGWILDVHLNSSII